MINLTLLRKYVRDARWLWLACASALFSFCWLRVWIVSQLDTSRFKQILDLLPGDWKRFSSVDFEWLITYVGRISLTYDEPIVFLCITIWAIARGSDCVSGELGRGTMEMLLAQPVGRLQILFTQTGVTLVGLALLVLVSWLGIYVGIETTMVTEQVTPTWTVPIIGWEVPLFFAEKETVVTPMSERVDAMIFVPAAVNLLAFGMFLAGVAALMSAWDRYRWRTIGIVAGLYVVLSIIKVVGMAAERLAWLKYCTIFTVYEPEAIVKVADSRPESTWSLLLYDASGVFEGLGPLGYDLVFVAFAIAAYTGAAVIFSRRDLPAPL